MHVVIIGRHAELAQPIIKRFLDGTNLVYLVGREGRAPEDMEPIDVLIFCQGKNVDGKVEDVRTAGWSAVIQDNLTEVFETLAHYSPHLATPANVVVLGSVMGSTGAYGACAYAASKAGLVGLVRSVALEWAKREVYVNLLELGYIDAGMGARLPDKVKERALKSIPLGRFGTAEDVVQAVDYLSRVRYMTGNVLTLAGGLR